MYDYIGSHCRNCGGGINLDLNYATTNISEFICILLHYLGMMADVIFIACSAWFLVDRESVRCSKIFSYIADKYVINIIYIVVTLIMGYGISNVQVFAEMRLSSYWFVMCYAIYYAFVPFLNAVVNRLDKYSHLKIVLFISLFYCCYTFVLNESGFYCRLIGFFAIYFIVTYVKKYMKAFSQSFAKNIFLLLVGLLGEMALLSMTNLLGNNISAFSDKMLRWDTLINPFHIIIAIALVNIFKKINWTNKYINYISSLSLLIYMIHANYFLRTIIGPDLVTNFTVVSHVGILMLVALFAIVLLLVSIMLSILYSHTFGIITKTFSIWICKKCSNIFDNILKK